jgi:hypothetical protein
MVKTEIICLKTENSFCIGFDQKWPLVQIPCPAHENDKEPDFSERIDTDRFPIQVNFFKGKPEGLLTITTEKQNERFVSNINCDNCGLNVKIE